MNEFSNRRAFVQFIVLLGCAAIFGVLAKSLFAFVPVWSGLFIACAVVFAWVAIVREANALSVHMPETICRWIRWVHAQTMEVISFVMLLCLRMVTLFRRNQPTGLSVPSRPILLVHGYLNAGFVWDFHKNQLLKNGFGPVYTINLGCPFGSIREYAKKVQAKAEQIAQETGRSDLTLIGHSMGGVVSYYYAAKMARAYSVPQVITIASPLNGTRVAKMGLGKCAREMEIDSDLLTELKAAIECCTDVAFYNIGTKTDELVIPYSSSILKSEPSRQYFIEDMGHASLLFSQRVSDRLCQWLRD